jgi:DNA-binding NarL/FixJ family response regulator
VADRLGGTAARASMAFQRRGCVRDPEAMKILIIDDHPLMRDALARVLADLDPAAVVREVAEPRTAFERIESEPDLDLVLLDLALPGTHGLAVLNALREKHPAISVVVVSASADRETVRRALDSGAMGYIPKSSSNEVLKSALQLVISGGIYIPPEFLGRGEAPAIAPQPGVRSPADIGLTERQAQILALLVQGEPNKVICRELDLAESTVKNQVTTILKALNVTNRTQAVLAVDKLGLALPDVRRRLR